MDIKDYLKSAADSHSPIHNLAIAFLQFLLIIFWFCKSIRLSGVLQYDGTYSMHRFCQNFGMPILSPSIIILLAAGIVFSLLPIKRTDNDKIKKMLIPKIATILTFILYLGNAILGVRAQTNTGSTLSRKNQPHRNRLAVLHHMHCGHSAIIH